MDQRQRIAMQRALVEEAFGKLSAAEQLFGIEDNAVSCDADEYSVFRDKVDEFRSWVFEESPIA